MYDKISEYRARSILYIPIYIKKKDLHYYDIFISNSFNFQGCYEAVKDLISTYGTVFIALSIVVMVVEVK